MKKSHRKDVIIARIIFVVILAVLICLITLGVKALAKHFKSSDTQQTTETQTESQHEWTYEPIEPDTASIGTESMGADPDDTQTTETGEETVSEEPEETPAEETPAEEPAEEGDVYYTTATVRMRNLASTDSGIITVVPAGTQVTVTYVQDNFGRISYDGWTGYVSMDYLSTEPQ